MMMTEVTPIILTPASLSDLLFPQLCLQQRNASNSLLAKFNFPGWLDLAAKPHWRCYR